VERASVSRSVNGLIHKNRGKNLARQTKNQETNIPDSHAQPKKKKKRGLDFLKFCDRNSGKAGDRTKVVLGNTPKYKGRVELMKGWGVNKKKIEHSCRGNASENYKGLKICREKMLGSRTRQKKNNTPEEMES